MPHPAQREFLTVPQMVADLGGAVSDDSVRSWCRRGRILGALNKGDSRRQFWIAPRDGWEQFKRSRQPKVHPAIVAKLVPAGLPRRMRYVKEAAEASR